MLRSLRPAALAAAALVVAHGAGAQTFQTLVKGGDVVPGVGTVLTTSSGVNNVEVNSNGDWLVDVDTNGPANSNSVILRNGSVFVQEDDGVARPPLKTISSFDSMRLTNAGDASFNHFLRPTGGADSGVYFNHVPVIIEQDVSTAPQLSPGTPYTGFFEVHPNDLNQLLIVASVDDPAITSTTDRALVVAQLGPGGVLLSESAIAKEGEVLPGQTEAVTDFLTGPHQADFNDLGQAVYVADLTGAAATDGVIYLDSAIVAQEGAPSPVAGRTYESLLLSSMRVSVNNSGTVAFVADLSGATTDDLALIVKPQAGPATVFHREGDTFPAIAPFVIQNFGSSAPVKIADNGDVLWFADWSDPDTTRDSGLFLNDQLLVQEGVTQIEGRTVVRITNGAGGISSGFDMSDDGNYIIFEAQLAAVPGGQVAVEGAFLIVLNQPPVCDAGGSYLVECNGQPTAFRLDGSGSADPEGGALTFEWSTDCPGATFDDATAAEPLLELAGPPPCPIACSVTLTVRDSQGRPATCQAQVEVADTTPPAPVAVLEPLDPIEPRSALSACSAPLARRFAVRCAGGDACDPAPELAARIVATYHEVTAAGACVEHTESLAVECDQEVFVRLEAPACPARPTAPRSPASADSAGVLHVSGESVVLEVTASDACGLQGMDRFDPAAEPSPACEQTTTSGECCPAVRAPSGRCRVPACGN